MYRRDAKRPDFPIDGCHRESRTTTTIGLRFVDAHGGHTSPERRPVTKWRQDDTGRYSDPRRLKGAVRTREQRLDQGNVRSMSAETILETEDLTKDFAGF